MEVSAIVTDPGARLGPFKGRVAGLGGQVGYSFKIAGKIPPRCGCTP